MSLRPFTSEGLRKTLNRMKLKSASGPDAWSVSDLRNLPDQTFNLLPQLFQAIEEKGHWPDNLLFAFCSLIPKAPGDTSPLGQRPLGIMSVIYRLYSAYRLQDILVWQEALLHHSQHGFRSGFECVFFRFEMIQCSFCITILYTHVLGTRPPPWKEQVGQALLEYLVQKASGGDETVQAAVRDLTTLPKALEAVTNNDAREAGRMSMCGHCLSQLGTPGILVWLTNGWAHWGFVNTRHGPPGTGSFPRRG